MVGSGDVVSVATARERLAISGADGLAIGRGAMENPWLFAEVAADLDGRQATPSSVDGRFAALRRYRKLLDEQYPEKVTSARLRGMACRTLKGFPGSAALREKVSHTRSSDELLAILVRLRGGAYASRPTIRRGRLLERGRRRRVHAPSCSTSTGRCCARAARRHLRRRDGEVFGLRGDLGRSAPTA